MSDHQPRAVASITADGWGAMGYAAPLGAVSRKERRLAARTALVRESPSAVVLTTAVPGTFAVQRLTAGRTWETLTDGPVSRSGQTRIEVASDLPPKALRVMFSPKNSNLPAWVAEI